MKRTLISTSNGTGGIIIIVILALLFGSGAHILAQQNILSKTARAGNNVPTTPRNFQAIPGDKQVFLAWFPNLETDLSYYKIYRYQTQSIVPSPADTLAIVFMPDTSYIDADLTNEQTYYYRISAVNIEGNESDLSEEVAATPQSGKYNAKIAILATEHNFGEVPVLASVSWQFIVENRGFSNLEIKNITSNNTTFSVSPKRFILEPFHGRSILVKFTPDSVQTEAGLLTVISNDVDQAQLYLFLSGTGIDEQSPEISLQAAGQQMSINTDYLLSAQIQDNLQVKTAMLYYRKGIDKTFQNIIMNQSQGDSYLAVIPSSEITLSGLTFFIKAEDSSGNSAFSDTVSQPIYFQAGYLTTNRVQGPYQQGYPRGEWRTISMPAFLNEPGVAAVLSDETELGEYGEPNWRLFSFEDTDNDSIADGYAEFDPDQDSSLFQFSNCRAFWLKANPQGETIEIDAGPGYVPPLVPLTISLNPGWNMIGNPYAFPISFSPTDPHITDQLYLPGGNDGYTMTRIMQPWAGYFVFVNGYQTVNLKLLPQPEHPLKKISLPWTEWVLQISASCGDSKDEMNFVGINEHSSDRWDRDDYPEPPVIGDYISLSFPHPEWSAYPRNYTADFRSGIGKGQVWDIEIRTNQKNRRIILSWQEISTSPDDLHFRLYDRTRNKAIDMAATGEYLFSRHDQEKISHFQLFVGSQQFVNRKSDEIQAQLPLEYHLFQNFPNPFNSSTQIRYQIPSFQKVSLKIYDLIGREVRTLVNEYRPAGFFQTSWDGKDSAGIDIGTGVYFCIFRAGNYFESRKVLVLK